MPNRKCPEELQSELADAFFTKLWEEAWNAPPALTELRVGGERLPDIIDLSDGRKVALRAATVGQWIDGIGHALAGPQREGYEIGRILLNRAGGDLTAKIVEHIDLDSATDHTTVSDVTESPASRRV